MSMYSHHTKGNCQVIDMLIKLIMVIISQCMYQNISLETI
jgi:hypothetical protein